MFVKLSKPFKTPIYTTVDDLESWAGIQGKGVHHKRIWSPDAEQIYGVLPERYWNDFEITIMTINSELLPHMDNDLITTINFYVRCGNYKTVFYKQKDDSAEFWRPKVEVSGNDVPLEQQIGYVKAVFDEDDLEEAGSFIAKNNEAWLLDVRQIHNIKPIDGSDAIRKAIALRSKKYTYEDTYKMLQETGNL